MAYIYYCIYQGVGSQGGLRVASRDPRHILTSGNTNKHVSKVIWMAIPPSL